jgi:hypothetical protein
MSLRLGNVLKLRWLAPLHSPGKGANKTRRIASFLTFPRSGATTVSPPHGLSEGCGAMDKRQDDEGLDGWQQSP